MKKETRTYVKKLTIAVVIILLAGFLAKPIYYAALFLTATSAMHEQNAATAPAVATSAHAAWQTENFLRLYAIKNIAIANDGKSIAFVAVKIANFKWIYELYYKPANDNPIKLLTSDIKIQATQWINNDQEIAYLAPGQKYISVFAINPKNQIKKLVFETTDDIQAFKFSPDNKLLAVVTKNLEANTISKAPQLIDVATNYVNLRLYLVDLNSKTKQPLAISSANQSIYLSGNNGFDFAPDSSSIVYAYLPHAGIFMPDQGRLAIYNLTTKQTRDVPLLSTQTATTPLFAPNGKLIAFYSNLLSPHPPKMYNNDANINSQICIYDLSSTKIKCLTNTPNQNPYLINWNKNSNQVYVFDFEKVNGPQLYALSFDPSMSVKKILTHEGYIYPRSAIYNVKSDTFGFIYETPFQAPEAFIFTPNASALKQVSFLQPKELNAQELGKVTTIKWQAHDGKTIDGLLILPINYSQAKRYPLLVAIHGGPMESWSKRYLGLGANDGEKIVPFSLADFLAQGFVVFQPNPRGSTGYGLAFRNANYADWGGKDYLDIISGIDYLINHGIADKTKLTLWGWSYGGYMAAWIIGHDQRFKAAVAGEGIYNLALWAGASDLPNILYENFGQQFWEAPSFYLYHSPISYTKNISTPLLLLHGEKDSRVIIAQANELYTALIGQNKPVKMFVLPNQEHGPTDPAIILEAMKKTDNWLQTNLVSHLDN